eukprot:1577810-Amphidinium_carterae.6
MQVPPGSQLSIVTGVGRCGVELLKGYLLLNQCAASGAAGCGWHGAVALTEPSCCYCIPFDPLLL